MFCRHWSRQPARPHLPDDRVLQRPLQDRKVSDGGEGRRQPQVHQGEHRTARLRGIRIAGDHETPPGQRSEDRRRRLWWEQGKMIWNDFSNKNVLLKLQHVFHSDIFMAFLFMLTLFQVSLWQDIDSNNITKSTKKRTKKIFSFEKTADTRFLITLKS